MASNIITANLDAVEAHFHSEAANAVDQAIAMYTEDIVWEAPARGLMFQGKEEALNTTGRSSRLLRTWSSAISNASPRKTGWWTIAF